MPLTTQAPSGETAAWYVIQCKGGESFRAAEHLSVQDFEVFHPVMTVKRKRRGKHVAVLEPMFPYYLFICLDKVASNWRPIRSTRGVARILTFGDQPVPVSKALIEALQKQPHQNQGADSLFTPGQTLVVTDGPFKDLEVIFKCQRGEDRAIVLMQMLQRPQQVAMDIHQLNASRG